ncbi:MAG: type VI secretion system baseplate subunit TssG [Gammaproteobacteria bacterium]|nr:type VI secretion system baseplate subunit TssG [Gammaproteobacteria bacterium]
MAGENRSKKNDLIEGLLEQPHQYDFFHALRLIECSHDDKPLIGQSGRPVEDAVRFGQEVSMAFESSTLSQFITAHEGKPARLTQRFLGLFGPNGPMPLHLTEYVRSREHNFHDHTLARFADIFHHRLVALFYRAKADAEPAFSFDRPDEDRFGDYLGALAGIGDEVFQDRDAMPDLAKFHYIGHLANQANNADGLIAILADFYKLPVRLNEFIGEWLQIETEDLTRLGESTKTGRLGESVVLGSRVWSCQHKFRVLFGPLTLTEYVSLLPSGKRLEKLIAIVRNYSGFEFDWDVNLILKSDEAPMSQLDGGTRLGWTSWLGERHSTEDANDLLLNPIR